MRTLVGMLFAVVTFFASQYSSASCVTIALLDEAGAIIKPNGLVVGFKIGDTPVFPTAIPNHVSQREVGPTTCSPEVLKPVQDLYNLSCRSDQAMRQVAENNGQQFQAVRQQCVALRAALLSAG